MTGQTSTEPEWTDDSRWRLSPEPVLVIGLDEGPEMQMFSRIRGVLSLPDGGYVVSNHGTGELRFFDQSGEFVRRAGGTGQGPGEFGLVSSMRMWSGPGGELVVDDAGGNGRVNVFSSDGDLLETVRLAPSPDFPRVFLHGVFDDGRWLTMGAQGGGRLGGDLEPGTIVSTEFGYFLHEQGQGVRALLRLQGRKRYVNRLEGVTHFPYVPFTPEPLLVAGSHLYVVPDGRPAMKVYDQEGTLVRFFDWHPDHLRRSADVWDEYTEASLASISDEASRARYAHLYRQDLPLPEFLPAYGRLLRDPGDTLWLGRFRVRSSAPAAYDAVTADGRWLGTVPAPAAFTPYDITDALMVGVHRDDMGLETIRVYRIVKP